MASRQLRKAQARRDFEHHYSPDDDDVDGGDAQIVSITELRRLSGCSGVTIRRFAREGLLPTAGIDDFGHPLFDLADCRIAEWVRRLQAAGYHLSPSS